MKTLLVALILTVAYPGESVAQELGGRIAYDYCYSIPSDDGYQIWCDVSVFDLGGSGIWVGSGIDPALSPDGTRVAFVANTHADEFAPASIVVMNLAEGTRTTLTEDGWAPAWSGDGRRIAFGSSRSGTSALYVMNGDGTGLAQVTDRTEFAGRPSWSPDDRIAFECIVETGNRDLCSINADGTAFARLTDFAGDDAAPAFSPDGTRIAFVTQQEIAILNRDGTVSRLGQGAYGEGPAWSPDGSRLAFSIGWSGACPADGRMCGYAYVYALNLDGTGVTLLVEGANPAVPRRDGRCRPRSRRDRAADAWAGSIPRSPV